MGRAIESVAEQDQFDTTRSKRLGAAARQVIPGGVNSNFRKDVSFQPLYMTHGQGAWLYDVDGNGYVDLSLSYGPAILGHSNKHLQRAIAEQAQRLTSTENTELEQRAARLVVKHVPCAELVRFASTGTEANYNAIRAARAYTGRVAVVRFGGHYHGGSDELLGGIVKDLVDPIASEGEFSDDIYSQMTHTAGRAPQALASTYLLEWNDLPAFERLLARKHQELAAVLLEPVMLNNCGCMPAPGFLEAIRDLCSKHGVVLIFDEVLTGFRMGLGGAQAHFGVIPDMATFAKALGGGMPVSAFCGKREMMAPIVRTDVVSAGTYNGHPVCMAAVIATLEELERDDGAAYRQIEEMGNRLRSGLAEISERLGHNLLLQGFPGAWAFTFSDRDEIRDHSESRGFGLVKASQWSGLLKKHGVFATARLCTSAAHTQDDVDEALNRAEGALASLPK